MEGFFWDGCKALLLSPLILLWCTFIWLEHQGTAYHPGLSSVCLSPFPLPDLLLSLSPFKAPLSKFHLKPQSSLRFLFWVTVVKVTFSLAPCPFFSPEDHAVYPVADTRLTSFHSGSDGNWGSWVRPLDSDQEKSRMPHQGVQASLESLLLKCFPFQAATLKILRPWNPCALEKDLPSLRVPFGRKKPTRYNYFI